MNGFFNPTYETSRILNERLHVPEEKLNPNSKAALQRVCGNYYPAMLLAIDFFLMQHENGAINLDDVAQIIAQSFDCGLSYTKKILKCYRGQEKYIHELSQAKERNFNFNIALMDEACRDYSVNGNVVVPEDLREKLLLQSNYSLSVFDVISAKRKGKTLHIDNGTQISQELYDKVEACIRRFDIIFDAKPNARFWELFFEYFPQYAYSGYFLNCIRLFPQLDEKLVTRLCHTQCVFKSAETVRFEVKHFDALCTYAEQLKTLETELENQEFGEKERRQLFENMSLVDFANNLTLIPYMERIVKNGLRSSDLRLTYRLLVTYTPNDIEHFFEEQIYDYFK